MLFEPEVNHINGIVFKYSTFAISLNYYLIVLSFNLDHTITPDLILPVNKILKLV